MRSWKRTDAVQSDAARIDAVPRAHRPEARQYSPMKASGRGGAGLRTSASSVESRVQSSRGLSEGVPDFDERIAGNQCLASPHKGAPDNSPGRKPWVSEG